MRVKRVAQGIEGRVNIGLSGSHFLGPFPQFIQHFRAMRPEVDVVLHAMAPAQQLAGIRGGRLDLSFERGMPTQEDLVAWLLWRDPAVVVQFSQALRQWATLRSEATGQAPRASASASLTSRSSG